MPAMPPLFRREKERDKPDFQPPAPPASSPPAMGPSGDVREESDRPTLLSSPRSFRFLRRKPSQSTRNGDGRTSPPHSGGTTSTFSDMHDMPVSPPPIPTHRGSNEGAVRRTIVVDGGEPGMRADQHPFMANVKAEAVLDGPLSPAPIYPTALTPPRRPMPRSRQVDQSTLDESLYSPKPPYRSRRPREARDVTPVGNGGISSSSHSATESDGEVGVVASKRRSLRDGQYEVEVVCMDTRDENDEMKWQVVIRRKHASEVSTTASPYPISTSSSVASAPLSASSINLSLSLDQPSGKLVFIAFPMDLHATPKRKPRPTTPPLSGTPPPAPNPNSSPRTPPPPSQRKRVSDASMWPSPSARGRRSPIDGRDTGNELWTPRRTRMVSAAELDGGLYARGTIDGMSEQLEELGVVDRDDRQTRIARWREDRI